MHKKNKKIRIFFETKLKYKYFFSKLKKKKLNEKFKTVFQNQIKFQNEIKVSIRVLKV